MSFTFYYFLISPSFQASSLTTCQAMVEKSSLPFTDTHTHTHHESPAYQLEIRSHMLIFKTKKTARLQANQHPGVEIFSPFFSRKETQQPAEAFSAVGARHGALNYHHSSDIREPILRGLHSLSYFFFF